MPENDIPLNWQPGQIIADLYEVKETTSGGMGVVYFVKHLKWGMPLAVKTPLPELVKEASVMNRFIKEAETWVNLGVHPNIASCYYVRELGGLPRIFIEYVDGGTLRDWIKATGTRSMEEILDIGIQICRGMEYVQSHGVIHRDLKPANCLMTKEGTVKITDFGIAKVGEEIADTMRRILGETPEGSITITGSGFGTPEYMSPEQFEDAKHVGKESDIYSFGVMLYEMVCGRKPFEIPEGLHQVAREHFYRKAHRESLPDEARVMRGDCPGGLNQLILKCLAKDPEKRLKSFREIEGELLALYEEAAGRSYSRKKPDPLRLSADSLNNRALSMLDLGKEEQAERYWEEALRKDPSHLDAVFNQGYYLWRKSKMDPYVLLKRLTGLEGVHGSNPEYWHNLIAASVDMGFEENARKSVEKALELGHEIDPDIVQYHSSLVRVFKGHVMPVISVAISPGGRYALSGSWDGTLRLWDMGTGGCLRVFKGHTYDVRSVAISPDGKNALSGSHDHTLRLWDMETGVCIRVFEGHTKKVCSVAISPDGGYALSGSTDQTLRLWDMVTGECLRVFEGHTYEVMSVAISPDGKYALSGGETLRLWDMGTGGCLRVFEGHIGGGVVCSVAISPDGRYALSGSDDYTLRLWDMGTGGCLRVFEGHTDEVRSVAISPNGKYALSGGEDKTLQLWNVTRKENLFQYSICRPLDFEKVQEEDEKVNSLILKASALINIKRYGEAYTLLTDIRKIRGKARNPQVLGMIRLCGFNAIRRRRLDNFWTLHTLEGHTNGVVSVAMSPDGNYALSGGDETLRLWDMGTGECLRVFEGHIEGVCSVAISSDGKYALSGGYDQTLRLWDMGTGECLMMLGGHINIVLSVAMSLDGNYTLSGNGDKTLRLWDMATGGCLRVFEGHTGGVCSVAMSLDGNYALSGSWDKTLRLWDMATGGCLRVFEGHSHWVLSVAMSPDGNYALSGGDETLRLWDMATGKCLRVFKGHTGSVSSVAISPDGKYALSGSSDDTLRLWDMATGKCLRVFEGHTSGVSSVAISSDGRFLLSGSEDRTLKIWELDWEYEFVDSVEN